MNRDDWEGQVWYLDENGRYAVRATNAVSDEYGAATFWTVLDNDDDGQPEADYSWTQAFVWQLESDITAVKGTLKDGDVTALVDTSKNAWHAGGFCDTWFDPSVTTSDGRSVQMVETYEGTVARTGEVMYQTVSGLENGDYVVEVYANALYTDGRGFDSNLKDGATDIVYVSANDQRCYVTAHVGTIVSENGVYTIQTRVSDGTLRISMVAEKPGTNWYTIQIKSLRLINTTITISSAGQGTYCSNKNLDFTNVSGIKAYVASGFNPDNGNILLMRVKEVPAGTGLLVKGSAGTYKIPVKETLFYYLNMLKPVFAATTVATEEDGYTNYVLANGPDGLMFYKSSGARLSANRAYLQIPTSLLGSHSSARVLNYFFDDEDGTTGINEVNNDLGRAVFYNLNGQRIDSPRKGIYLRNGKKMIIK